MQRELLVRKEVSQDIQGHLNEHFKMFNVINEHQNISFEWFLLVSAVCEHLHPHLHRGVGRQIPAGHHRPCRNQRCGSLIQKGKSKHHLNLHLEVGVILGGCLGHAICTGGAVLAGALIARCFFGASNLLEQPCIICCIICIRV